VPRRLTTTRGRLLVAALGALVASVCVALIEARPAASAKPKVTISGRAYVFNHAETGIAGATIRVRELPNASATTDANGDYELKVPDDTTVTPYIEPPAGYNQIDLQTFHTRGKPIVNANFQTPADAEYNALSILLPRRRRATSAESISRPSASAPRTGSPARPRRPSRRCPGRSTSTTA